MGLCSPQLDTQCWGADYMAGIVGCPPFVRLFPYHTENSCFSDLSQIYTNYSICLWVPCSLFPPHLNTLESGDVSPARPRDAKNGDSWTEALGQHLPVHPHLLPLQTALLPHTQLILNQ